MKKIIVFIFLFAAVTVSAQDIPADDTTAKPAITEIGKPDGEKSEMKIGKEGGSFTSSDGKIRLIIPEGAISKKTTFSIQPVTNLMPNGDGKSYRLEPSGIQFQKPVQLIFHYTSEESADSMQLLMGIAMQSKAGQWYSLKKFTLDTIAKTISGDINHFSDWSKFYALKISPSSARVKVKKSILLDISGLEPSPEQTDGDEYLTPLSRAPKKVIWSVNDIVKGNSAVGILTYGATDRIEKGNLYKAPDIVPNQNPVAVSVKLQGLTWKYNGINFKDLRLVSNILIYDNAYEVKMTSYIDQPSGNGSVVYRDTGSFVVSLNGKETKIIEKINKNTNDEFNYELPGCKTKTLNSGSGYIHMIGAPGITVTPATATQPARVRIQFKQTPLRLSLLELTCTDRDGKTYTSTTAKMNAMLSLMHAYPQSIEFTAREGEEEWEIYETAFNIKEGVHIQGRTLLKYIVRRLKDNE